MGDIVFWGSKFASAIALKMKESVSSAFYMGTLKMQGDLRKHYAKHRKKGSA